MSREPPSAPLTDSSALGDEPPSLRADRPIRCYDTTGRLTLPSGWWVSMPDGERAPTWRRGKIRWCRRGMPCSGGEESDCACRTAIRFRSVQWQDAALLDQLGCPTDDAAVRGRLVYWWNDEARVLLTAFDDNRSIGESRPCTCARSWRSPARSAGSELRWSTTATEARASTFVCWRSSRRGLTPPVALCRRYVTSGDHREPG